MKKLVVLISTLKDLKRVHKDFRIRIKLSDFDIDDKSIVSHQLMDWCTSAEELQNLVDNFLLEYFKKFQVDKDHVSMI